jgi:hypothetical protein
MVGWSRRARESRERHAAAVARAQACVGGGCKCYCHAPKEEDKSWVWMVVLAFTIYFGGILLLGMAQSKQNASDPYETVCRGMTSTGAPYDCVKVLKKR